MNVLQKILCILPLLLFAASVHAETIADFSSHMQVRTDGAVQVREEIQYDFGADAKHGIFRILDNTHPQEASVWYKKRSIDIAVLDVQMDGGDVPYEITELRTGVQVKIGDPATTIAGTHVYTITYVLRGALSYGDSGAELYYNVTGNDWEVPIERATVIVDGEVSGIITGAADCYVGAVGATERCEIHKGSTSTVFYAGVLIPTMGLTVGQEINTTAVEVLVFETASIGWLLYLLGCIWLVGFAIWGYRFHTQNKRALPIVAQYEPYKDFLPMFTGVLLDHRLDPHDITAGIVYLAEQGFITIKKTEQKVLWLFNTTDYQLTLKKPVAESMVPLLQLILEMLFGKGALPEQQVMVSKMAKNAQENQAYVKKMQTVAAKQLREYGFIVRLVRSEYSRKGIVSIALVTGAAYFLFRIEFFIFFVLVTILIIGVTYYNQRTSEGYEALNHLQGFALFLSVTEKERYAFHNAPEKSPELFMKYLPYAIALKVEKQWAKVFEGITIPAPSWYEGDSGALFSAGALTSDLGAFSSAFTSSSGTSGSKGHGSSGGGGGGGGGGSW